MQLCGGTPKVAIGVYDRYNININLYICNQGRGRNEWTHSLYVGKRAYLCSSLLEQRMLDKHQMLVGLWSTRKKREDQNSLIYRIQDPQLQQHDEATSDRPHCTIVTLNSLRSSAEWES